MRAATRVAFRPIRSPKCPKRAEPTGRARKARAKVARELRVAATGFDDGKNSLGKTSTAAIA
jgi:hypothetical protein